MELQDVIEAQMILGKLSVGMVLAIAKDPSLKAVNNKFNFFEGEPNDAWEITIEKVKDNEKS